MNELVDSIISNYSDESSKIIVNTSIQCNIEISKLHFVTINNLLIILNSLLKNVYQHSNASTLSISLFINERVVECTVTDNGIGISPDYLSSSPWYSSLHKAYELIYLLNGELNITGNPNQGTSIRFFFPTTLNS